MKACDVYYLPDGWHAIYNGKEARTLFNCKGAAAAWLSGCIKSGKWRA